VGGERRPAGASTMPTTFRFTGQREQAEIGLYFYGSRYYDSYLNRWIQPDSIIPDPGKPIDLDLYAYARNNPLRYTDPNGHWTEDELDESLGKDWREKYFGKRSVFEKREKLLLFLTSKNTTDPVTLEIIRELFETAHSAFELGFDFSNVDAIGMRVTYSQGAGGFGSFTGDAILNLTSGEFSVFGSLEGGVLLGESIALTSGVTVYTNMPSNDDFRGVSKNLGIAGGDIVGLTAEESWGDNLQLHLCWRWSRNFRDWCICLTIIRCRSVKGG
jgi:RHS repeat-associated protein